VVLISDKLLVEINKQIGRELGASNQYLNIAAYFDAETLPELASFFYRQSVEEREHALKFAKFIVEAGGRVAVPAVEAARADMASAEAAVKLSVDWEMEVTRQINALLDLALQEKDRLAMGILNWFVAEQLEEVSSMEALLAVVRRAGPSGLLFVEDYLARRSAKS
jgi:ferritin